MTAAAPSGPDLGAWLQHLADLHAKATPGPWSPATAPSADSGETHAEYLAGALRPDEGRPLWVAWAPAVEGLHDSDYVVPVVTGDGPASEANARLVAEMHAALPDLLRLARDGVALRAAVEGLAEKLEKAAADAERRHSATVGAGPDDYEAAVADSLTVAAKHLRAAVAATTGDAR